MIFLIPPILAIVLLILSAAFTREARDRRAHLTDVGRTSTHQLAMTFALWAIAILLLWIGIR